MRMHKQRRSQKPQLTLLRYNVDCLTVKSELLIHVDLLETHCYFKAQMFGTSSPERRSRASVSAAMKSRRARNAFADAAIRAISIRITILTRPG